MSLLREFITDPCSQQGSMSRLCLPLVLLFDLLWVVAVIKGWPNPGAITAVSGMLAGVTASVAGIYAVSTHKGVCNGNSN